ncbi:MAG: hypothetical protein WC916_04950 [Candidatus Woesearchaeota archaeon]
MNQLFRHKQAIIFSLIAVLLAILFISLYTTQFTVQGDERTIATATRAKVIDTYVRNFEKYAESSLKIATYRNLDILTKEKITDHTFYADEEEFKSTFMNCTTCGYINCESAPAMICSPDGKNFGVEQFLNNISQLAKAHMNINTTYAITIQKIEQDSPFEVKVTAQIMYVVSDMVDANNFRWNKTTIIIATVPIDGLFDPLTSIYTNGSYNYSITPTTLCKFNESCWNITTTTQFYRAQEFRYMPNATAYLPRFWNDNTLSSCCGIEALLNITKLNVTENNSYVDHEFWTGMHICNETDPTTQTIIEFTTIDPSTHFRLDDNAAARYNIAGNGVQVCNPNPIP